jgi:hypothetical protein
MIYFEKGSTRFGGAVHFDNPMPPRMKRIIKELGQRAAELQEEKMMEAINEKN